MNFPIIEKYESMQRSYSRLMEIKDCKKENEVGNTIAVRDAIEDFFNQTYHFKDWLKKDENIQSCENVELFISSNEVMSIAADYCNAQKHAGLDENKSSRSGKLVGKLNTHTRIDFLPTGVQFSSDPEIEIDGSYYNAFDLATSCMKEWELFLKRNKIVF